MHATKDWLTATINAVPQVPKHDRVAQFQVLAATPCRHRLLPRRALRPSPPSVLCPTLLALLPPRPPLLYASQLPRAWSLRSQAPATPRRCSRASSRR